MRISKLFSTVLFFYGSILLLHGQDLGGMSSNLNWGVLKGDSIQLITTAQTLSFAKRALFLDEALIDLRPAPLGPSIDEIDIVVQPSTVIPNGFVGLEPYRSYLFATPPQRQDLVSATPWTDILAIHEYRHVEQYANLNRGWTRFADFVFGDGGRGLMTGLSTPNWFFEGDAVYYETALTYGGRGRTPSFTAVQRAMALDSIRYGYLKARNGSLKDRVPDQYPLGYAMVTHGLINYQNPWPEVVKTAGKFWPPIVPFSTELKRQTGLHTPGFYKEAYDSLGRVWKKDLTHRTITPHQPVSLPLKQLERYSYPQAAPELGEHTIVALRRSQTRIPELIQLDSAGDVRVLAKAGINIDGGMHYANKKAVWTQLKTDPTRRNETYSVIVVYDFETKKLTTLTKQSTYFGPGLSSDGRLVVAAEQLVDGTAALVFLDTQSGELVARVELDVDLVAFPRFSADDLSIIALTKKHTALWYRQFALPNSSNESWRTVGLNDEQLNLSVSELLPYTRHTLGTPYVTDSHLYFSASFDGYDNIYRLSLDDPSELMLLTGAKVAALQPSFGNDKLYFIEIESNGDKISSLSPTGWLMKPLSVGLNPEEVYPLNTVPTTQDTEAFRSKIYAPTPSAIDYTLAPEQQGSVLPEGMSVRRPFADAKADTLAPYKGLLRGFSFYTLQPLADQNEASLTLFGGNVLGDLDAQINAGYNLNEARGFGSASITYAKSWPWVSFDFGLAERRFTSVGTRGDSLVLNRFEFEQQQYGLSLQAPINQVFGHYNLSFTPSLGVDYFRFGRNSESESPVSESMTSLAGGLRFSYLRQTAAKDILPRAGITFSLTGLGSISELSANRISAEVGLLFPGVLPAHTGYVRANLRSEDLFNQYQFPDFFRYARGTNPILGDRHLGLSLDYHFPIWYPDIGIPTLAYLKRVRLNTWADYQRLDLLASKGVELASAGLDVVFDLTFFNVQDLPIGFRLPFVIENDQFGFNDTGFSGVEFLLSLPL